MTTASRRWPLRGADRSVLRALLAGALALLAAAVWLLPWSWLEVDVQLRFQPAEEPGLVELFDRVAGGPFDQARSIRQYLPSGPSVAVSARFQRWGRIDALRLDTGEGPGTVVIEALRLTGPGGRLELSGQTLRDAVTLGHQVRYTVVDDALAIMALGTDPHSVLDIPESVTGGVAGGTILALSAVFLLATLGWFGFERWSRQPGAATRVRRLDAVPWVIIGLVVLLSLLARLSDLGGQPPRLYFDEAATAANILCLAEDGRSAFGDRWPMYVEVEVGNWEPPSITYPAALLVILFGDSVAVMRLTVALAVIASCFGLLLIAREFHDRRLQGFTLLLATLSPWSFQAGRLLWKSPLAPAFVVFGVWAFLVAARTRSAAAFAGSAALFSLAVSAYQSSWPQVPLLTLVLFALFWPLLRGRALVSLASFGATAALLAIPFLVLLLSGDFLARASEVAVTGSSAFDTGARIAGNLLAHLDPRFLFIAGDSNLRHSIAGVGQLSWVDAFAWLAGGLSLLLLRNRPLPDRRLLALAIAGIITGLIAAAVSNEGIPHGLRANGAWPFFALLGAWLLTAIPYRRLTDWLVAGLASAFLAVSMHSYFVASHPEMARYFPHWGPDHAMRHIATGDHTALANAPSPLEAQYYLMSAGGLSCTEATRIIHNR